jgi:ribosomal protein L13
MKTTYFAKPGEVEKKWVLIDATDKVLGRIASKAASIIRGKTKPTFTPHTDTGDNVIIINAAKVKLTGKNGTTKSITTILVGLEESNPSLLKKCWKKSLRICCKKPFVGCYLKIDWDAP